MKKLSLFLGFVALILVSSSVQAQQDKSKRASPPAKVSQLIKSGATVTIDYSQPSVKGRTIGKEIAPYGQVWRMGANEATTLETDKDVTIEGKPLAAGKYNLYAIPGESEWTIIINADLVRWGINRDGTTTNNPEKEVMRLSVKPGKSKAFTEQMTFTIDESGKVVFAWGDVSFDLSIK